MMKRLALLFVAVAVATLVSTPARAAVPMCSDDGRSVVAPPIVFPWRMQTLEAPPPCPQQDGAFSRSLPGEEQRAPTNPPAPMAPRAVPIERGELATPLRVRSRTQPVAIPRGSELIDTLYRPPRG
ncbi:MAG TPA: hypothetical protein VMI54_19125 [Polyangiaceae bacterium]|nr:hypothetical protein [Polyangiaceae bacterium]